MDEFGKDFKKDVLNAVKMESKRLESQTHSETPKNQEQLGVHFPPQLLQKHSRPSNHQVIHLPPQLLQKHPRLCNHQIIHHQT